MGCKNKPTEPTSTEPGKILFSKGTNVDRDIFMINPDGTGLTPIIQWVGSVERTPHVSPDGTKLAFISNKTGADQIWVANIDGSNSYRVTHATLGENWNLSWHPNSQYLIYDDATSNTDSRVCKIKTDGTDFQVLIDHVGSCEFDVGSAIDPADSNHILYQLDRCWNPTHDVYNYNLQSQTEKLILNGPSINAANSCYSWSPDGSKILFFISNYSGFAMNGTNLYIMNSDSSNRHAITSLTGTDGYYQSAWSPDGSKIVTNYYSSNFDDAHYLYIMNSDGSNRKLIYYSESENVSHPEWAIIH